MRERALNLRGLPQIHNPSVRKTSQMPGETHSLMPTSTSQSCQLRSAVWDGKQGDPGFPTAKGGEKQLFLFTAIRTQTHTTDSFQRVIRCHRLTFYCALDPAPVFIEIYPSELPSEEATDVGVLCLWAQIYNAVFTEAVCNVHLLDKL